MSKELELIKHIVEALERSMPMKVDIGFFEYCPKCRKTIRTIYNYCPYCGQAIDWSEYNE